VAVSLHRCPPMRSTRISAKWVCVVAFAACFVVPAVADAQVADTSSAPPPATTPSRVNSVSPSNVRPSNGLGDSPSFNRMRMVGESAITPRPGVDLFRARPGTYAPPSDPTPTGGNAKGHRRRHADGGYGGYGGARGYAGPLVVVPYVYGPYAPWDSAKAAAASPRVSPTGRERAQGFLRLLVRPRSASVFVDGVYEGTVDDFGGSGERTLPAGPHRIRLEAEGHETVVFDARVPANDTLTLRRELDPRVEPPRPAAPLPVAALTLPPVARKTLYVIPRCYLGDSLPKAEQLPAGCRLADLQTLP
jgi:hypothetical protein